MKNYRQLIEKESGFSRCESAGRLFNPKVIHKHRHIGATFSEPIMCSYIKRIKEEAVNLRGGACKELDGVKKG